MRKRFTGDTAAAQEYTRQAAKLLDVVKHDMQFTGRPQGVREIALPNGVIIRAISQFGQDEVQIYAPPPIPVRAEKLDKEEPKINDYMWIGVRATTPMYADNTPLSFLESLSAMLIEPDGTHQLGGLAGDYYSRQLWWSRTPPFLDSLDPFDYAALNTYRSHYGEPLSEWTVGSSDLGIVQPVGFEPLQLYYGRIVPYAYGVSKAGGVMFSAHGAILYDSYNLMLKTYGRNYTPELPIPYDPKIVRGLGAYPNGQYNSWPQSHYMPNTYWHAVYVLDPKPEIKDPGHKDLSYVDSQVNKHVATALKNVYGRAVEVLPGEYILKVCANGYCRADRPAGPVEVEIEVRLGKPEAVKFTTKVVIDWWSEHPRAILPFGSRGVEARVSPECGSPNPHGPMWWQGALKIDVKGRKVELVDRLVPEKFFGSGTWDGRTLDACGYGGWYNRMIVHYPPASLPSALSDQAAAFAKSWFYQVWYSGEEGWSYNLVDWSKHNWQPVQQLILDYAAAKGRTSLASTKIIFSGYPIDEGNRLAPSVRILEMSNHSFNEWQTLIAAGQMYNTANYDRQPTGVPSLGLCWHYMSVTYPS